MPTLGNENGAPGSRGATGDRHHLKTAAASKPLLPGSRGQDGQQTAGGVSEPGFDTNSKRVRSMN